MPKLDLLVYFEEITNDLDPPKVIDYIKKLFKKGNNFLLTNVRETAISKNKFTYSMLE